MRSRAIVGIAVAASVATAALPAQAGTAPRKKVAIYDNFYLPQKLSRIKPGTIVAWKWPDDTGDVHDVKLKEKPKKAKRFWSPPASVGFTYKQKLTVPGKYHIICTLHEEMEMNITVRKPAS